MKTRTTVNFKLNVARAVSHEKLEDGIRAAGSEALSLMRIELSKPGTGREYPRGKDAVHVASIPGQPPAPDYGQLRQRIDLEVNRSRSGVEAEIVVNSEYAAPLHFGTERVKARPFADAPIKGRNLLRLIDVFKRATR